MIYKYDEIIAVLQTERGILEEKIDKLKSDNYAHRFDGIYEGKDEIDKQNSIKQIKILENMSPEQFEQKRLEQAMQLHYAYKQSNHMWCINPGKDFAASNRNARTNIDMVRRCTGKYAERGIYNTDILFLDYKTIRGIEAIAWAESQPGENNLSISGLNVSSKQLLEVVDELVATREFIAENLVKEGDFAPTERILATETNVVKRAIGLKKNENVYGIEDYSVTAEQMLSRKKNPFKKIYAFLGKAWKKMNENPNIPKKQDKFGDKTIYLNDEKER